MDKYEAELTIQGLFPPEIKPQLTKDIRVITERINPEDQGLSETVLGISFESPSMLDSVHLAQKKINQFLAFYSVTTLNHFQIIINEKNPLKLKNLSDTKESEEYGDGARFPIINIDSKVLLEHVMIHFPLVIQNGNEYLKVAIEYLLLARFTDFPETSILDCMVALEALFSKSSGESTEIGYKISNRVATLLGKDSSDRIYLRKEIKDLYNLRSRIVHGDSIELSYDAFKGLFLWTKEAILRFLTLVSNYDNHNKIIERIDDAMIDNSILEELRNESSVLYDIITAEQRRIIHGLGEDQPPES